MAEKYQAKARYTGQDWDDICWKINDIPFHKPNVYWALIKFYSDFISPNVKTIFLPLCGKSLDLVWLAKKGLNVTGLEFSEIAVKAVFEESGQKYFVERMGKFVVYKSKELPLTIYKGDFWDISPEICGKFDAIWDRGGFTVIVRPKRPEYAKINGSLLNKDGKLMLFAPYYESDTHLVSPFSATEAEVHSFYDSLFDDIRMVGSQMSSMPLYEVDEYDLRIYLMQLK